MENIISIDRESRHREILKRVRDALIGPITIKEAYQNAGVSQGLYYAARNYFLKKAKKEGRMFDLANAASIQEGGTKHVSIPNRVKKTLEPSIRQDNRQPENPKSRKEIKEINARERSKVEEFLTNY